MLDGTDLKHKKKINIDPDILKEKYFPRNKSRARCYIGLE